MICPKCGAPVAEGLNFCQFCGNNMNSVNPDATVLAANAPLAEHKPPKKSGKGLKIGIAAAVLAIVAVVAVVLVNVFVPGKQADEDEDTVGTTRNAVMQETEELTEQITELAGQIKEPVKQASEETIEKALNAYEAELSLYDDIYSVYAADINKDGVPEVICQPEGIVEQFAMTYTEKSGLSKIMLNGHSSMPPEIYISEDNCLYMRDDGHNEGTMFYHYAAVYEIDETGFVLVAEVEGEEPAEEIPWEDKNALYELDEKYDDLFSEKTDKLTGYKIFKAFSEVANTNNPVEYLNDKLSINISQEDDVRQIYEDYLSSTSAQKYFEPVENDIYFANEYNGNKELFFKDIDDDGIEECILTVPFPSDQALSYETVHIFDVDGETVRHVYATKDCGSHRAQEKFALIEKDGSFLIHHFYTDPHGLGGCVFSYDGTDMNVVWSYDCDVTNGVPEEDHVFLVSQSRDVWEAFAGDYLYGYYYAGRELPEDVSVISADEFYETYNEYRDSAVFSVPE